MRMETAPSWPVSIFIAGDYNQALETCRAFCDDVGLCVTVTATTYAYTDGEERGVVVGLINYPRFPSSPTAIERTAEALARKLRMMLGQESFSIQTPEKTTWFSWRAADLASVDTLPEGQDAKQGLAGTESGAVGAPASRRPTLPPQEPNI